MSQNDAEKNAVTDLLVKAVALLVFFLAFAPVTGSGWADAGVFGKGTRVLVCLVALASAIGFFTYQGWAFLVVSAGLLLGFFYTFIHYLLSWDVALKGGEDERTYWLLLWLGVIALIGFVGRWSTERHFRPHLDVDHH